MRPGDATAAASNTENSEHDQQDLSSSLMCDLLVIVATIDLLRNDMDTLTRVINKLSDVMLNMDARITALESKK